MRYPWVFVAAILPLGCANRQLAMPPGVDWHQYAIDRDGSGSMTSVRLRPDACEGHDLRPEYDAALIRSGARGKYAQRYREGTNVVLLEPDVAAAFPDAKAVNQTLRLVLQIAKTVAN